jgi:hypothetical protein
MKLKIKHMKKLALLTIILFTTLSSFSQTVTNQTSVKQDTIVPLKQPIAKLVIKDLLSYDGLQLIVKEKDNMIASKDTVISFKDKIIGLKDDKINNLNLIIDKKDQQINLYDNMAKDLQKELKVQQMKTKFYKAGSIVGIGVAIITTTLYIIK